MSRRNLAIVLALPVALALSLTGCFPSSPGGGYGSTDESASGSATPSPSASAESIADCAPGTWSADLPAFSEDLAIFAIQQNPAISSLSTSGTHTLTIDAAGSLTMNYDLSVEVLADAGDGRAGKVDQDFAGDVVSDWAADDSVDDSLMTLNNFDTSGLVGTTEVYIDGVRQPPSANQFPSFFPVSQGPLTVTCAGDVLTTLPADVPLTMTWHRQ